MAWSNVCQPNVALCLDDVVKVAVLVFAEGDGLADAEVGAHDLREQQPAAAALWGKPLADDEAEGIGEPQAELFFLALLEHAE